LTRALLITAALVTLAVSPVAAHKGHASPSPAPSPAEAADETPEATLVVEETAAAEDSGAGTGSTEEDPAEQGALAAIPWKTAFTGHLHNKIVHFPLALGLAAAVILIVAPRWPAYEPAARVLLIAGAVAAVAAYLTGGAQEEPFEDSPFHSVVELHEKFGIGTAITLWAGVALTFWARARRFLPVYGLLLILLLTATGFLGGVLSHS
jgi:uncharacterized membrane protein